MSKLIVITAPNSSLPEERDAVEKELQKRLGRNDIAIVLLEGWSVSEFNIAEPTTHEGRRKIDYSTIASVTDLANKKHESLVRESETFKKIRGIVDAALEDSAEQLGSIVA